MRRRRVIVSILFLALVATACSGGATGAGSTAGTTVPVSVVSTSAAPPTTDATMSARATAAVLQLGDFPAGWKALTAQDGGGLNLDTVWSELTHCLGADSGAQRAAQATSPTFVRGLATQARSTVEYTSESAAGAIGVALDGPKFQGCATDAFNADVKRSAPEGGVPGPVALAPLNVAPLAPKTASYRITATINLDELKVPLFQDFLVMFKGGTVIRMLFLNPGAEFPPDLERSLVQKVLGRV